MNDNSISIVNLNSGEILDTKYKSTDTKFTIRGHKMYNNGVLSLLDVLTNKEIKTLIGMYDSKTIGYGNIFTMPFHKLTEGMDKSIRSRYKKKLVDNNIILQYRGKIMLNPFTFLPKIDKNVQNYGYRVQQMWKYLTEDQDIFDSEMGELIDHVFGI